MGKPTPRGLRITVEQVLQALSAGVPKEDILEDYPELELEDIHAAQPMLGHGLKRSGFFLCPPSLCWSNRLYCQKTRLRMN